MKNPSSHPPVVFFDVDGNINTMVDPTNDYSDPRIAWAFNDDLGIRYNPQIIDWVRELDTLAEIRWLTLWDDRARTELAPALGLPDFQAVRFHEHRYPEFDWKHSAVLSQMVNEPGRPVVWVDDEPDYGGAYDQLMPYAEQSGTPFFSVKPTMSDGLTEAHMLRIRAFLEAQNPRPSESGQTLVRAAPTTAAVRARSTTRTV